MVMMRVFIHRFEKGTTGRNLEILRAVTEIPTQFRCIFKEFPYFNYAQSKALDDLLYTDRNFVICAPTGSGKTVMFELAITRLLMEVPMPWLNIKVVYSKYYVALSILMTAVENLILRVRRYRLSALIILKLYK
uniref:Helicase for meiosis 1 n=1 Tax=Gallus gallus TaxID=9031 RepID=A0A8V0ZE64_CHICK